MSGVGQARSERFRADVGDDLSAGDRVLVDEACRLIDWLDKADGLIRGEARAWAEVEWPFEESPAVLVISSVVSERRQHVAELRQVVKQLAERKKTAEQPKPEGQPAGVTSILGRRKQGG